jgi:hypothetical protein
MQRFIDPLIRRGCGNTGMFGKVAPSSPHPEMREMSRRKQATAGIPNQKLPDP